MPTQELIATDPSRVGPYTLLHRLGSGGMGVVYLGEGPDGRRVAVKCLPHGVGGEVRGRLRREATYLSQVRHPRVAAFVAADTQADRPWVAMQYVAGPSLAQASVPLGPAQLRHLVEGLADALAALHAQGLTHRDVKPGNIILTHDGPVLVDLGIAAGGELTALTAVGMVVGTPEWMAPEQLTGQRSTHAVDLWGWACVAAFAATGRPPFGSGAVEALAYRIRHEAPDLRGVPDWLQGALLGALDKDPRSRPTAPQLAAVDGIRAVGAVVRSRLAPPRVPVAAGRTPAPLPPRTLLAPPVPGPMPPVRRPVAPPTPPPRQAALTPPPSVREAKQARKQAKQAEQARQAKPVKQSRKAARQAPPPARRRRSFGARLLRRLLITVLLLVAVAVVATVAYSWIRSELDSISWGRALRELRDQVTGWIGT